jgi:hypothetical protein
MKTRTEAYTVRDKALERTKALPDAATENTVTDPIELPTDGQFTAPCELEASVPDLTTTMLPNDKTATYELLHADSLDGGALDNPEVLAADFIVQTGAGGAGAAASVKRFRPPVKVKRYVALRCTLGEDTTNSSTRSMTLDVLF